MGKDEIHHHRRSIRWKGYDYAAPGGYFVTVVAFRRECLFGEIEDGEMRLDALGDIVRDCWQEIPNHFPNAWIDAFVIMPNHVHGIIMIFDDDVVLGAQHAAPLRNPQQKPRPFVQPGSLGAIMRSFKSAVTRRAGRELHSAVLWQRNYYEHILRDQADFERIASYILSNPENWQDDKEHPSRIVKQGE
jgi:putative transposase